jgi:hypothetical protein
MAQAFIQQVQDLQRMVTQANPDGRSLQAQFLTLQQTAQQGLLTLPPPDPDPAVDRTGNPSQVGGEGGGESLVGYQTEISRALRLLAMDITFLQSARQAPTQQKRQGQIRDRLSRLQVYGERVRELLAT